MALREDCVNRYYAVVVVSVICVGARTVTFVVLVNLKAVVTLLTHHTKETLFATVTNAELSAA